MTENRSEERHNPKGPGEPCDELLAKMVEEYRKTRLFEEMDEIREDSEFEPLEEG